MGGYFSSEAAPPVPPDAAAAAAPVAEEKALLSLRQRLGAEGQRPWPERRPLRPEREEETNRHPVGQVPKEVWDLVLGFLSSAEDAVNFGRTCLLFAHVLRASRVWPRLLDGRYGDGMSAVLAQSRAVLEAVQEHRRVETAELVAARETFYRRARLEMIRLHLLRLGAFELPLYLTVQFRQFGELRVFPDIVEWHAAEARHEQRKKKEKRLSNLGGLYWSAAVFRLPEDPTPVLAVVVAAPHGHEEQLDWLRLRPVFWKGLPVLPFDVFRERCVNITVRLFGAKQSIVLCATVKTEAEN